MDIFPSVPARSSTENTRYQYDQNPYPEIPVDQLLIFKDQSLLLAKCNFITPYYLRNRVIPDLSQCHILDVGCGSGWKTIALAIANPGAQILGIDFSAVSIAMANDRCRAHNLTDRVQFQCLSLEALQEIDRQFDMIHCDEILYLIQDPLLCLQLCQGLLKPDGIIRGNFHSLWQRHNLYQMQEFLREIGVFHESSEQSDIDLGHDIFQALKPSVILKKRLSKPKSNEEIRMNWMLQGDRGFTIPQVFGLLEASNLEYIQMLDWPSWQILELFDSAEDLKNSANSLDFLLMGIAEADLETQLNLYDLLNPIHR
ncbi:MAG: class I SAM-dependent methyltransferase, partial [Prochlorotrichaceae cyanobacterium]